MKTTLSGFVVSRAPQYGVVLAWLALVRLGSAKMQRHCPVRLPSRGASLRYCLTYRMR